MNIEFTHINNQAIIKDENGKAKMIPYYDNLKQVLIQENVIELMEEEMKKVIENYDYYKDKKYKYIPLATILLELFCYFGTPLMFKAFGAPEEWLNELGKNNLTNREIIRYVFTIFGFPCGLFMDYNLYVMNDADNDRKNASISEKELLEKQINFEKKLLEKLQSDKTNSNIQTETDYEIVNLDIDLIISKVQNLINFFYNLGYNEKKLYRSFTKDKLDKYYSGYFLEQATEYFEEKGPVLAKKYNKNKF